MRKNNFQNGLFYFIVFVIVIGIASFLARDTNVQQTSEISSSEFVQQLEEENVKNFSIRPEAGIYRIEGEYDTALEADTDTSNSIDLFGEVEGETTHFTTTILRNDSVVQDVYDIAKQTDVDIQSVPEEQPNVFLSLLASFLPFILFIGLLYFMMGQAGQGGRGGSGNVMNFGKSRAKQTDPKKSKVRFSDVAGAEEEKAELVEIVEFLKDPRRYTELGARIPAGVLLEGPPGTGKTLLAKAVAGEAGVPFFSISGSEFVEMFVGVGASRVRDLFENAKKSAPAIVFIDEIDAVGRKRGSGMGGGNDEREQTLNQLLVEMDGFSGNEGVIVMAATNRSDVLDQALLRPGRFDRRIMVGMPDVKEREAILRVHAKGKPLASSVELSQVARTTPGFSGADLENLLNEAALVAARRNSKVIEPYDVDEASDRVIAGPQKTDRVISATERKMVAYHEAGHTVVGLVLNEARVVHKVTIVPRGKAGGYAIMLPREDRYLMTKKDLFEQIVGLLGGRVAEEIFFDSQSSGASNDFQQATGIARRMVTEWGMSDTLGPVQYESSEGEQGFQKPYSERVAYEIDSEIRDIMNQAHDKAEEILNAHRDQLVVIAEKLLEVETLNEREIKSLFETGEMPKEPASDEYPREDEPVVGKSFEEIREETVKKENKREAIYDEKHDIDSNDESVVDEEASESSSGQDPVPDHAYPKERSQEKVTLPREADLEKEEDDGSRGKLNEAADQDRDPDVQEIYAENSLKNQIKNQVKEASEDKEESESDEDSKKDKENK